MQDHSDQQLGNYRIGKLLGRGGFADVYLATHIYLRTQAAIKVLHTLQTEQEMEDFIEEARIIARLQHPHIVQVLEFGIDKKMPFLVMTYAPNGTMRMRYPRGTRLPLPTVVGYIKQIASALQYVHDQKLIYRDLKPENLLMRNAQDVLLSDFGIALVAQTSYNPGAMATAGTIAYMPPEQLQGKPRLASDQYALGIIVYEWLSGERPFTGSFTEMASQHLLAPPPPLRQKLPNLSPDVEKVVLTALAKEPQQRFANVRAFATALEQAAGQNKGGPVTLPGMNNEPPTLIQPNNSLSSAPTVISPGPFPPTKPALETPRFTANQASQSDATKIDAPIQSTPHSDKYMNLASGMGGVQQNPAAMRVSPESAASAGDALAPTVSDKPVRISRRAVLASLGGLAVVGGAATFAAWFTQHSSPAPASSISPPVAALPIGHVFQIYRQKLAIYDGKWAPDRAMVVTVGNEGTARIWDPVNGKTLLIYTEHTASVNSVSWSPDSAYLVTGGSDLRVLVWNARTGKTLFPYIGHATNVRTVAWSPTGELVASSGEDGKVHVWEAKTGKRIYLYTRHVGRVWSVAWSPDGQYLASGGDDTSAQVWEAKTGKILQWYRGHKNQVKSLDWSPNGTYLVSGSDDRTVQVWNARTGKVMYTYTGHVDVLNGVSWSPDGKRIASGSGDYTVQLWEAFTGNNSYSYSGHILAVHAVHWNHDGTRVLSVSDDHTAQIWKSVRP
ncbi:MAG TPA: protein kinase [Ktedonobacteraceae bacterium]|nr:protein kinase [Ktedonobacteraceae bacterium]